MQNFIIFRNRLVCYHTIFGSHYYVLHNIFGSHYYVYTPYWFSLLCLHTISGSHYYVYTPYSVLITMFTLHLILITTTLIQNIMTVFILTLNTKCPYNSEHSGSFTHHVRFWLLWTCFPVILAWHTVDNTNLSKYTWYGTQEASSLRTKTVRFCGPLSVKITHTPPRTYELHARSKYQTPAACKHGFLSREFFDPKAEGVFFSSFVFFQMQRIMFGRCLWLLKTI